MANLKASISDIRESGTAANVQIRSRLKTLAKRVESLKEVMTKTRAAAAKEYVSALDVAAKKGIIHKNKVAVTNLVASCCN